MLETVLNTDHSICLLDHILPPVPRETSTLVMTDFGRHIVNTTDSKGHLVKGYLFFLKETPMQYWKHYQNQNSLCCDKSCYVFKMKH